METLNVNVPLDPIADTIFEPSDVEELAVVDTSLGVEAATVGLSQYGSDPIRPVIDYSSDTLSAPLIYHRRHEII